MNIQPFRMYITPISPVHIGAGESYEPSNYVIDDGWLHEFDTGAVLSALTASDRKLLLEIGNRKPDVGMIKSLQQFFFDRREKLMAYAVCSLPVLPSIDKLYRDRVGQAANREADGGQVVNRLEIDRTAYDSVGRRPVMFGSSLKGSMRTAILNFANGGRPTYEKQGLHPFQGQLLDYNQRGKLALELDPLRLLQPSDAHCTHDASPSSEVLLAVNRKKASVIDTGGNVRRSQAEAKDLYQILECVLPWQHRGFSGQLNVQRLDGIPAMDQKGIRRIPEMARWPNVESLSLACNDFYIGRFEAEMKVLRQRRFVDQEWDDAASALVAHIGAQRDSGRMFLLRVGRHSGAESVTLDGVRKIKIMAGKGQQSTTDTSAKTLWLAAQHKDQAQGLMPFGWVVVELDPFEARPEPNSLLAECCSTHASYSRELRTELVALRSGLEQKRHAVEALQRQDAETAARQSAALAEAARVEAERLVAKAALTPNLRLVEDFNEFARARYAELRGSKERPNEGSHQRVRQLAKSAHEDTDWTSAEKLAVALAIEGWLPKLVDRIDIKDERKKLKLNLLKTPS